DRIDGSESVKLSEPAGLSSKGRLDRDGKSPSCIAQADNRKGITSRQEVAFFIATFLNRRFEACNGQCRWIALASKTVTFQLKNGLYWLTAHLSSVSCALFPA
ncbi:hypothetical protein, partial [Parasphingorhabdus sp.]|uniref:hypothetical protein n=1 Tax=Parasphingorhabdus sp. TaxID=2709688 RepID=UPI00329A5768